MRKTEGREVSFVQLNRRFHEWNQDEPPDPEILSAWGLGEGGIGWEELLRKRRAVVLAEAGSGKSTEFTENANLVAQLHPYVFHTTVEEVGLEGLDAALPVLARRKLAEWRRGIDDAWFFIDSVDEAKLAGVRFDRVIRKVAEGILGAESRCYIFLSGRATDWEPRRDLETLKRLLPVSCDVAKANSTPEQELLRIIRNEGKRGENLPPDEKPYVAIMAPLDPARVRLFAEAAGLREVDRFLRAIDEANLWHFAKRPLDLDWLVRMWHREGRLGTLQEMVQGSIVERLKETNPDRRRGDDLDGVAGMRAVERIGAAMVFGRQSTLRIPDREFELASDNSLDLGDILPDWSADERDRLLGRPVFDPATFGRARFHNDNDGTVRSYLAARWLMRLREANLSTGTLLCLFFANSYGLDVIRPSLSQTAAWLCLWDKHFANETVRLAPGILLISGDPASLSNEVRRAALSGLLRELLAYGTERPWWEWPWWDNDKLRRFAQPDLGEAVQSLWPQYGAHQHTSQLLMRLIWLGGLKKCYSIAQGVAFDSAADPTLRTLAGKALLSMADTGTRKDYAALITAEAANLPSLMVRDAISTLSPGLISISDVLRILSDVDVEDDRNSLGFETEGPALAEKLVTATDLDFFLTGLLRILDTQIGNHAHHSPTKREETFFPAVAEAALRLLRASPSDAAPNPATDALLRICNKSQHGPSVRKKVNEALKELHRTADRRRQAFWRVVTNLREVLEPDPIDVAWRIEFLGYSPGLRVEDIEWLLADGIAAGGTDSRLAVSAALRIYWAHGKPEWLLTKIAAAVESCPAGLEAFREWTAPRLPSESEFEMERQIQETQRQNEAALKERDQWWINLITEIRSNSGRIATLKQPVPKDQQSDLVLLWRLLDGADNQSRYAMNSVAPIERIAGPDVASAMEAGLIAHWRACEPSVRSRRSREQHSSIRWVDLMGLTGITLEASKDPAWAMKLSDEEARRATEFATLEINGFPRWISDLVAARPEQVNSILLKEIEEELTREDLTFYETLHAVAYGADDLVSLMAPGLLEDVEAGLRVPPAALPLLLRILVNGLEETDRPRFEQFGIAKFERDPDTAVAVQYVSAVFSTNPSAAARTFMAKAMDLDEDAQTSLVDQFLTACFGESVAGPVSKSERPIPPEILEELLLFSFKTHKQVVARRRPTGVVYETDETDRADQARNAIFSRFVKMPGAATYQALQRFQQDPTFPVPPARLAALAEERAVEDSEAAPWPPGEAYAFEQSGETAPRTGKDLRSVLIGRIEEIQHDLLHGDFSQRQTLKGIGLNEREVQKWVAYHLRLLQGRSFSVEREPHVVDEKEPDIRVRAKASDATVSIEIKVADSWSLTELDKALEIQLCGRYLRSDQGRYGILLLVHQGERSIGWQDKAAGRHLSFPEVVDYLHSRALAISGERYDSPQPEVAAVDVSGPQVLVS